MLSAVAETINVSIRPRKEILFYSSMIFVVNLSLSFNPELFSDSNLDFDCKSDWSEKFDQIDGF